MEKPYICSAKNIFVPDNAPYGVLDLYTVNNDHFPTCKQGDLI